MTSISHDWVRVEGALNRVAEVNAEFSNAYDSSRIKLIAVLVTILSEVPVLLLIKELAVAAQDGW